MILDMTFTVSRVATYSLLTRFRKLSVPKVFDPYIYYEKTKFKNFQESSRLEGIVIDMPLDKLTLKDILNKYRR